MFAVASLYVWARIEILRETEKAVLVDNGAKFWIAKSQIRDIRLRKDVFEVLTDIYHKRIV